MIKWLPGECADWFFDNIMTWSYCFSRRYSMFRQKNSILINEHPLNREPVPLRTHQLNYHYLQTTFMYLFNLYLTSNYFNFITTAKTTNSYTAQLWALHFFFFHFPLYFIHGRAFQDIYFLHRNSTKCFWIDLVRVLATTGIASLPEIKKRDENMGHYFNHRRK